MLPNRWGFVVILLVALQACGHPQPQPGIDRASAAVPVYREPMHRLVFQTPLVRVLDVRVPAGDTTAYHIHANRLVGFAVQDARTWSQVKGARPGAVKDPAPTPSEFDNWSQALPYTHRVANVDTIPLHYIVAEWLRRSGVDAPVLPDTAGRRLIKEGPTSRVYQITLMPGQATGPHTHAAPGLTVQGNEGFLVEDGQPRGKGGSGAGRWSWHDAQYQHVLRNEGTTAVIVYELDWR